jgi:hypothetical protein
VPLEKVEEEKETKEITLFFKTRGLHVNASVVVRLLQPYSEHVIFFFLLLHPTLRRRGGTPPNSTKRQNQLNL